MKRLLVIAAILPVFLFCQASGQLVKHYGVKVGLTSAGQKYDFMVLPDPDMVRRSGINVAGFIEWFNLPLFSVVTQIEYVQKGMGMTVGVTTPSNPVPTGTITLYNRLDYISVPVFLKLNIPAGGFTPYAMAGVRIDHLLGFTSDKDAFNDVYDRFDRNVPGGTVGAGVELGSLLPVGLLAEVRYNIDFSDSYTTDILELSNNAFDVWVGIIF